MEGFVRRWFRFLLVIAALGGACAVPRADATSPEFGDAFWKHSGDGRAEIGTYDLVFPRYGATRRGVAVAVFVTETFSNSLRVKSDPGQHPKSDEFPVMKLNLVRDFQTGIYDYNLMTSAFVALASVNHRPAGSATKVSFSSQEWCGNVYAQLLLDDGSARHTLHSYFDGEADREDRITVPNDALSEDALLIWARGLASPLLGPGESRDVDLLRSLLVARMRHQPVVVEKARLEREAVTRHVTVPAGAFDVEIFRASVAGGRRWTLQVEKTPPHRIVSWETSDGESGKLVASDRLKYWQMNGPSYVSALSKLGLKPRPPRTP
jgi:hypothetical protein